MIKLIIIGKTNINWNSYLAGANQILHRSVSKTLDEVGIKPEIPLGFLTTLHEIKSPGSKPSLVGKNPGFALDHVHYNVAMFSTLDELNEVIQNTKLSTVSGKSSDGFLFTIISGDLDQWRSAVINSCTGSASFSLRSFGDRAIELFDSEGLGAMFSDYNRVQLPDNTFKLQHRK